MPGKFLYFVLYNTFPFSTAKLFYLTLTKINRKPHSGGVKLKSVNEIFKNCQHISDSNTLRVKIQPGLFFQFLQTDFARRIFFIQLLM